MFKIVIIVATILAPKKPFAEVHLVDEVYPTYTACYALLQSKMEATAAFAAPKGKVIGASCQKLPG